MAKTSTDSSSGLNEEEERDVDDRGQPRAAVVFETIRREGKADLKRPVLSLVASGFAAGLSIGMSLAGQGLIRAIVPAAPWRPLVESFGYTLGFLIVVLGRQQLFTETTVTAILPLLDGKNRGAIFVRVVRLWSIVLATNIAGAMLFAVAAAHAPVFSSAVREAFLAIGKDAAAPPFGTQVVRGIAAGWVIALMVWMLPGAEQARVWVIIIMTYIVGLAGLSHIVAGSAEVFYLVAVGQLGIGAFFGSFVVPVAIGNAIGGVLLVSLLNYGQVVLEGSPSGND